jgi:fluoroquinolone transport system permease protein
MSHRLLATVLNDVRLQWRNGFYLATAVITALFALLLQRLPSPVMEQFLPALIVNNLIVNGFYFISGLVLLEKGEGTLEVQVVTPLRPAEYLAAKATSLTFLSLLENGLLGVVVLAVAPNMLWLVAAISAGTLLFVFSGFYFVCRYHSLAEFLLPSLPVVTLLALPLLPYFGLGQSPLAWALLYLHPLQPVLLLLRASFGSPVTLAQLTFALPAALLWSALSFVAAQNAYRRFVPGDSAASATMLEPRWQR